MSLVVIALIAAGTYFLPVIVAAARSHPALWPIVVVTLFAGWTVIGWVAAMAWSMMPVEAAARRRLVTDEYGTPIDTAPPTEKTCPKCAESVKPAAVVCRYCGHEFRPELIAADAVR